MKVSRIWHKDGSFLQKQCAVYTFKIIDRGKLCVKLFCKSAISIFQVANEL